ncbi:MAG TPA: DinB family protein [Vicinamibacterales bacterium]|nr:DinB family protein [Vicinamibacterales bacterium]
MNATTTRCLTLVAALLLPFAIGVDGALPALSLRGVVSLAYVGPIATAFAYWSVVKIGRYVPATTISVTLLAVPSVGLLISAFTFHEGVNAPLISGVVLIGAAVVLPTTELSADHHRGQVAVLLRELGYVPGNFDLLFYDTERHHISAW